MTLTEADRTVLDTLLTGNISDAMEWLDLPRTVVNGFKFIGKPHAKLVGPAVTVRQIPKSVTDDRKEMMVRHLEVSSGIAGKGDVVIVDVGGRVDVCSWGEFHTYRCLSNGVAGVIVNGSVRDAAMIRDSGMPTLCRGVSPLKSLWDLKTSAINEPIMLGTTCVNPGDIIMGDEDGVVVFPVEKKDEIIAKAVEIRDHEDRQREDLRERGLRS